MAELAHDNLVEQILIRLDVKHLFRCKSVCKSWHSLITSPGFISRHQNSSYIEYNNIYGYTSQRAVLGASYGHGHRLVGSSNGLVCIIIISEVSCNVLVINPSTREVRQLRPYSRLISSPLLCWGFGYDSSRDDYTVFVGSRKGKNQTCFQVLSLKSNVWRVIGEVKYNYGWWFNRDGVLRNGALHWIVTNDENNQNIVIIAYDLSKEEFREIPQPYDPRYEGTFRSNLGIVKECLCIFRHRRYSSDVHDIWLMKKYNVKESWELLPHDREFNYDIVHELTAPREVEDYILPETSCFRIHVDIFYPKLRVLEFMLIGIIFTPPYLCRALYLPILIRVPSVSRNQMPEYDNVEAVKMTRVLLRGKIQDQVQQFDAFKFINGGDLHSIVMTPRSMDIVFKRLNFAIKRG